MTVEVDVTVAVTVTDVGVVASPWTLLLVKTSEVEPFGLAETVVVVAAADAVVNEIDHDPSDPDGIGVVCGAMYSVQVPCMLLAAAGREKALVKL